MATRERLCEHCQALHKSECYVVISNVKMENSMRSKRSGNFTYDEKDVLLSCVEKRKTILENKKTDNVTTKEKDTCWEAVAVEFNNEYPHRKRTSLQLKQCWKNVKKTTKQNAAAVRRSHFQTGGGPATSTLGDLDERVLAIVPNQVHPLTNNSDGDAHPEEPSASVFDANENNTVDNDRTPEHNAMESKIATKRPANSACDEFTEFYRLKKKKLEREIEIMEEEAILRRRCLEKKLEIKTFHLNQMVEEASKRAQQETSLSLASVYKQLS